VEFTLHGVTKSVTARSRGAGTASRCGVWGDLPIAFSALRHHRTTAPAVASVDDNGERSLPAVLLEGLRFHRP